jgi:hypothetical protein
MQRGVEEQVVLRDDEMACSACHWTEQSVHTRGDLRSAFLEQTRWYEGKRSGGSRE